jgi:hypothetical protein
MIQTNVPKAGCEMHSRKDLRMTKKESRNRNFDPAFETIFGVSRCFQRSKEKLNFYFFVLKVVGNEKGGGSGSRLLIE